jgi:transposase InsO family protein
LGQRQIDFGEHSTTSGLKLYIFCVVLSESRYKYVAFQERPFRTLILDSFLRKVVGYTVSNRLDTDLALAALKMALEERQPTAGCIHHSDQGVMYASNEYIKELKH